MGNFTFLFFLLGRGGDSLDLNSMLFIPYFVLNQESEPESESFNSLESESELESERPHHDSAPLKVNIR